MLTATPSAIPSQSPTDRLSGIPSHVPVEDLITICRCDRSSACLTQESALASDSDFFVCLLVADAAVVSVASLQNMALKKSPLVQTIVRDGSFREGSFVIHKAGFSLLVAVGIDGSFFDRSIDSSPALEVSGDMMVSRKSGHLRRSVEAIGMEPFEFSLLVPVLYEEAHDGGTIWTNATGDARDENTGKTTKGDGKSSSDLTVLLISVGAVAVFVAVVVLVIFRDRVRSLLPWSCFTGQGDVIDEEQAAVAIADDEDE